MFVVRATDEDGDVFLVASTSPTQDVQKLNDKYRTQGWVFTVDEALTVQEFEDDVINYMKED